MTELQALPKSVHSAGLIVAVSPHVGRNFPGKVACCFDFWQEGYPAAATGGDTNADQGI